MTLSTTFTQIPTDKIVPSPYQYRKTFGGAEDEDLAESVRKHGVLQPVRVRPNGKPGMFELVFGERRWRAAKAAELDEVPAIVVELGDDEVIEQLLVENLKRRDVHPLEEGEGYQRLLDKYGYTIDQLVSKTGKSKAHLYGRMKLAKDLAPGAKKAVLAGKLPVMHAELIARIADHKLQEQCTRIVLGQLDHKDDDELVDDLENFGISHERVSEEGTYVQHNDAQPLSFRATRALIRQKFATRLSLAKFDTADAVLTSAGACTTCEHRSGNQPGLPGIKETKSDDTCLKPSCFEAKSKATFEKAAAAAGPGVEILEKDDAKKVFAYDGVSIAGGSPYVQLGDKLPWDLQKTPGTKTTWNKLLGKRAGEVPKVLVQDESGAPRELIDKAAAVKLLREEGKLDKATAKKSTSSSSSSGTDYKKQQEKEKAARELNNAALTRSLELLAGAAAAAAGKNELQLWRWIARIVLRDAYEMELMAERRGVDADRKSMAGLVDKTKTIGDVRALLVEGLAAIVGSNGTGSYASKDDRAAWDEVCKMYGIDHEKALVAAKEATKAETKVDAKKKAKKGAAKK